jgi:hypothetical protein
MSAIEASTVSVKTMADDTLRLTVDIEPRFAQQAFALFGQRGRPLALAALLTAAEHPQEAAKSGQQGEAKRLPVPKEGLRVEPRKRSARAFLMTKDPSFQRYMYTSRGWDAGVSGADEAIKFICSIASKSELDTDEQAAAEFEKLCTEYNQWLEVRR